MFGRIRQSMGWESLRPVIIATVVALVGVAVWYYMVRPDPLPAAEVRELLADKTAAGQWAGSKPYLIYFAPDGSALYGEPDQPTLDGAWRVAEDGTVCAGFGGNDEGCYGVGREAGSLVWILPGSGRTYAFSLREGRDPAL